MTIKERIAHCVALNTPLDATIKFHHTGLHGFCNITTNFIYAPRPSTRRHLAVFLHEVGHYNLGHAHWFDTPIHKQEYAAHMYAFAKMREVGLSVPIDMIQKAKFYTYYSLLQDQDNGFKIDPKVRRFARDYDRYALTISTSENEATHVLSQEYKDAHKPIV